MADKKNLDKKRGMFGNASTVGLLLQALMFLIFGGTLTAIFIVYHRTKMSQFSEHSRASLREYRDLKSRINKLENNAGIAGDNIVPEIPLSNRDVTFKPEEFGGSGDQDPGNTEEIAAGSGSDDSIEMSIPGLLRAHKDAMTNREVIDQIREKFNPMAAMKNDRSTDATRASLIEDRVNGLEAADYWIISTSSDTYVVVPGTKHMRSSAALVADDGRPAKRQFRGTFEIVSGTSFVTTEVALASKQGEEFVIMKTGEIQLPNR